MTMFQELVRDAFGDRLKHLSTDACWIQYHAQPDDIGFTDELLELALHHVRAHSQWDALVGRFRREHPVAGNHAVHDAQALDVLNEVRGFGWTAQNYPGRIRRPEFWEEAGRPDIRVGDDAAIEVKTIRFSLDEQARNYTLLDLAGPAGMVVRKDQAAMSGTGVLFLKLSSHLQKAAAQVARSGLTGVAFFAIDLDFPYSRTEYLLREWALAGHHETGLRVVVIRRKDWLAPFFDSAA